MWPAEPEKLLMILYQFISAGVNVNIAMSQKIAYYLERIEKPETYYWFTSVSVLGRNAICLTKFFTEVSKNTLKVMSSVFLLLCFLSLK